MKEEFYDSDVDPELLEHLMTKLEAEDEPPTFDEDPIFYKVKEHLQPGVVLSFYWRVKRKRTKITSYRASKDPEMVWPEFQHIVGMIEPSPDYIEVYNGREYLTCATLTPPGLRKYMVAIQRHKEHKVKQAKERESKRKRESEMLRKALGAIMAHPDLQEYLPQGVEGLVELL